MKVSSLTASTVVQVTVKANPAYSWPAMMKIEGSILHDNNTNTFLGGYRNYNTPAKRKAAIDYLSDRENYR